jgi:hypothetical protein
MGELRQQSLKEQLRFAGEFVLPSGLYVLIQPVILKQLLKPSQVH